MINKYSNFIAMRVIFVFVSILILSTEAYSQTLFETPSTNVDIKSYDFVEKCLAKIQALVRDEYLEKGIYKDTLEFDLAELRIPISKSVQEFASKCGSRWAAPEPKFDADTVYYSILHLLLYSDRLNDLRNTMKEVVILRSAINEDSMVQISNSRDLNFFFQMRPLQLDILQILAQELVARSMKNELNQILAWHQGMYLFNTLQDTLHAHLFARKILASFNNLTDEDKERLNWEERNGQVIVSEALDLLADAALMDSLRKGVKSYVDLKKENYSKATGRSVSTLSSPIGEIAAKPEGRFIYDYNGQPIESDTLKFVRPTFLLFLGAECSRERRPPAWRRSSKGIAPPCQETYAAFRRLNKRFPSFDFVILSKTVGFFGNLPPQTPKDEADLLQKWLIQFHGLHARFVVEETDHWFLPGYDKRRIDNETLNEKNYSFGKTSLVNNGLMVLVDIDGTVLYGSQLRRGSEFQWNKIASVVKSRYETAK